MKLSSNNKANYIRSSAVTRFVPNMTSHMCSASVLTNKKKNQTKQIWNGYLILAHFKTLLCMCAHFLTIFRNCVDTASKLQKLDSMYPRNKLSLGHQESFRKRAFSRKKKKKRVHGRKSAKNNGEGNYSRSGKWCMSCHLWLFPGKRRPRKEVTQKAISPNSLLHCDPEGGHCAQPKTAERPRDRAWCECDQERGITRRFEIGKA